APWLLLAGALALEVAWLLLARPLLPLGGTWTVRPGPPTLAHRIGDVAHLLAVPLVVAALVRLPHASGDRLRLVQRGFDAAAVALALVVVGLRLVLPAALPAADPLDGALLGAQAVGSLVVVTVAVVVLGRLPRPGGTSLASFGSVAVGVVLVVVGDVAARLTSAGRQPLLTAAGTALTLAGFVLVVAGARRRLTLRVRGASARLRPAVQALAGVVPMVLAGTVLLLGAVAGGPAGPGEGLGVALLAAVVAGAALSRVEAQALARTVEERVTARTVDLGAREKWFRSLVHHASDVVTVLDPYGVVRFQTPSGQALLGHRPQELVGTPFDRLLGPADEERLGDALLAAVRHPGERQTLDLEIWHRDGHAVRTAATVTSLLDDADVRGLVVTLHDVSADRRLAEELSAQASTDPLTGLANRTQFRDRVEAAAAGARRRTVGVLFIDLDGFKGVNDSLGHQAGDRLLEVVALRLRGCVRPGDTVARLGGDEFAILVCGPDAEEATTWVARRVWQQMAHPVLLDGRETTLGASTGVAVNDRGDETAEQLLRNADLAMYRAKAGRQAMFVRFEEQMRDAMLARARRQDGLRQALRRGEVVVLYQPVVELASGRLVGAEAVTQWIHPEEGPVPPQELVTLAEETGLVHEIGSWALREACRHAVGWQGLVGDDVFRVGVNVSVRQLVPAWPRVVRGILAATGLPPEALTLEVTESVLAERAEEVLELLRGVRRLGVGLVLDDVGTGVSSLSSLTRLPVDALKVDRSFVEQLGRPAEGAAEHTERASRRPSSEPCWWTSGATSPRGPCSPRP
ncbi:MAG: EAL domain-containing protein, partial [Actinomycetia bacterium]|nr:EAL domain-containing protein [Actinomycetes bacterium]